MFTYKTTRVCCICKDHIKIGSPAKLMGMVRFVGQSAHLECYNTFKIEFYLHEITILQEEIEKYPIQK